MMEPNNGYPSQQSKPETNRANPYRAYVELFFRRKWTIAVVFLIVLLSTMVYQLTRPDVFMARAVLLMETRNVNFDARSTMAIGEVTRPLSFYQGVLGSRPFREQSTKDFVEQANSLSHNLMTTEINQLFDKDLFITKSQYLEFFELYAKANDPDIAFLVCDVATKNLKNRCQEIDQEETQNIVDFVEKQKQLAREKLEEAEKALQELRDHANISISATDGDVINQLAEMENQLADVQSNLEMAQLNFQSYEARLEQINGNHATKTIDLDLNQSPEVLRLKNEITQLEQQYRDLTDQTGDDSRSRNNLNASVEIQSLNDKLNTKKKQLVQAVVKSSSRDPEGPDAGQIELSQSIEQQRVQEQLNIYLLKNRVEYYQRRIENFKKKNPNMLDRAMEFARLSRAKTVYENMYNFLIERGEEARIKAATGTGGVRIIDPPTKPKDPIPINLQRIFLTATLSGLALGFVIALAKDRLDDSFYVEEDVTGSLGLSVLGMIPAMDENHIVKNKSWYNHLPSINRKTNGNEIYQGDPLSKKLITNLSPKDPIPESYRELRTNISFLSPDKAIKTLVVTSTLPSEGKTLTSANLAISFAEIGKKVVLVDTDLRKPKQHHYFNMKKTPGLTSHLYDNIPLLEAMTRFSDPTYPLHILPTGKLPPNPVQTLTSARMRELKETLSQEYDIVIFDTPPLISVTDPLLLAAQVDGVLMVIKSASTQKEAARQALGKLKTAKANILGIVLNNVDFSKGYGYYNYYYQYRYYYDSDKDVKKKDKKKQVSRV